MQTIVIFSMIVAIAYFLAKLTLNRFIEDKKTLKTIAQDSCLVFLSVLFTNYAVEFLGIASLTIKQKGGNPTAAFTSRPEF